MGSSNALKLLIAFLIAGAASARAATVYPSQDGTLADGGSYGIFDGVADNWDWTFNQSSYEGAITLTTAAGSNPLEIRVVWEYNLASVSLTPPVFATLNFTIRGAPIYPFPDVVMSVYAYPADLLETSADFSAVPAVFVGSCTILPYQAPTQYSFNVSTLVNATLSDGTRRLAFRFQVDPSTENELNQAFIDASDSTPSTKPYLTIAAGSSVLGDTDGDGDADLDDYSDCAACLSGPGVGNGIVCDPCDLDDDGDVDLADFALFQSHFTG